MSMFYENKNSSQVMKYKKLFLKSILFNDNELRIFIKDVYEQADANKNIDNITAVMKQLDDYKDIINNKTFQTKIFSILKDEFNMDSSETKYVKDNIESEIQFIDSYIYLLNYKLKKQKKSKISFGNATGAVLSSFFSVLS